MDDFIYWSHPTAVGIRVEEVSGGDRYSGKTWMEMARQIFAENGKGVYREIGHTVSRAPLLIGTQQRISVSHTSGLLVVAMLPSTPDSDLQEFSLRTALGVDTEKSDRKQVIKVREKFLSLKELEMIPAEDIEQNILAWTAKEAVFKALLSGNIDFRKDIIIESLPEIAPMPIEKTKAGRVFATRRDPKNEDSPEPEDKIELELYAYRSEEYIVCLAYSSKCALYQR